VHDGDDERRRRGQPPAPLGERAARGAIGVVIDRRAQGRPARSYDAGSRARQIVASDCAHGDHRAQVARELARAVAGRHAPQRPRRDDVDEAEISQGGEGTAQGAFDHPAPRRECSQPQRGR
jgi:hypothetical protein